MRGSVDDGGSSAESVVNGSSAASDLDCWFPCCCWRDLRRFWTTEDGSEEAVALFFNGSQRPNNDIYQKSKVGKLKEIGI